MDKKKLKTELKKYIQLAVSLAIIVGIILLITLGINPWIKYMSANSALDQGEYEKAIQLFEELGDYKDSADLKAQAQTSLELELNGEFKEEEIPEGEKESYYLRAKSYIENGKFGNAAAILKQLGSYKDSATLLEKYKLYVLEPGDSIEMGKWVADVNSSYGPKALNWTVVEVKEDHVVLLCDSIIDCREFDIKGGSAWDTSSLRTFLNGEFYDGAFSAEEKKLILKSSTVTEENPNYKGVYSKDCSDNVFVPSIQEFKTYMTKVEGKSHAKATKYALGKGLHEYTKQSGETQITGSWFWLRSGGFAKGYVAHCFTDGDVSYGGEESDVTLGVRPAIKIELLGTAGE